MYEFDDILNEVEGNPTNDIKQFTLVSPKLSDQLFRLMNCYNFKILDTQSMLILSSFGPSF